MATDQSGSDSRQEIAISLDRGSLLRGGRHLRLRGKTFQVLVQLHEHQGRLVTKEALFRAVWPDTFVSDDSLTKCVREIREALGDRDHRLLKTVARRGFILDAALGVAPQAADGRAAAPREPTAGPRHNLPAALASFVGRSREIAELRRLLSSTRLLTLMGAGGWARSQATAHCAPVERPISPR